jgi:hypothetical protein
MKIKLLLTAIFIPAFCFAQERSKTKVYFKSASEFIFSMGMVDAKGGPNPLAELDVKPVVRFSGFFHLQEQLHFDFSKHIGIFTGIGVRNVGMINNLSDSVKVKQRVYSLGIPLALKLGKFPGGFYVASGAEGELFFHYKQKDFYDGEKRKRSEWFSDRVNLFNPSVFLDFNTRKGSYIRFKYYLMDFLVTDKQKIRAINGLPYYFSPSSSQLFYIAIGTSIKHKSRPPRVPGSKVLDMAQTVQP